MIPCPTYLIPNLQILCEHNLFSRDIYRFGINYRLWMVWCAAQAWVISTLYYSATVPDSLHTSAIYQSHNIPTSGHQGIAKTLRRLQQVAYWVGMAQAVAQYCN